MMGAVREWLAAVVTVSLLLSVVQTVIPEGSLRKIAGFTGGLVLLLTLLRPVLGMDLESVSLELEDYRQEIQTRQAELEKEGEDTLSDIIERRTAAYISDKADTLGLSLEVRVRAETGEDGVPVPASAELWGPSSQELAAYMEQELGIPRERQVWHETES